MRYLKLKRNEEGPQNARTGEIILYADEEGALNTVDSDDVVTPVGDGNGGSQPLTAPTEIADLLIWLDASQLAGAHGDPVTTWPDLSGNDYDATQSVGDNKPTLDLETIPPLPFVNFDPSVNNQWLEFSALDMFNGLDGLTCCAVIVNRDGASPTVLLGAVLSGGNVRLSFANPGPGTYRLEAYVYNDDATTSNIQAQGGAYPEGGSGNWAAVAGIVSFDLTTGFSPGWEGGIKALLPADIGGSANSALNNLVALGPFPNTDCTQILLSGDGGASFNAWDGGVVALMLYGRALTASERRQLLEYVGDTYNVA